MLSTKIQRVRQWLCKRCGYSWEIRDPNNAPKKCPRCHDANWQKPYIVRATDGRRKTKQKFDSTLRRRQRTDNTRPERSRGAGGVQ